MLSLPLPNPDDFKVDPKEMEALEVHAASVIAEARNVALTVHSVATCEVAAEWIRAKKAWVANIKGGFLGQMRDSLHKLHKQMVEKIDDLCSPTENGIKMVTQSITAWRMEDDRKRREEEARLLAEAKKRDEEERLKAAQQLEADGNKAMADAVLQGVGQFVAPIIPQEKPKGVIPRKYWKAEVTDKRQLLKFLAEKPGYENAVDINVTWLATQAKLMDGNLNVPGVRFWQQDSTTIR
jgi:hypothetical protein